MKNTVLIVILLVTTLSIFAQDKVNAVENIAYMGITSHEINLFVTNSDDNEKFYFSDEIKVNKSDIPRALKFAFTLGPNFVVDEVLVDGLTSPVIANTQYYSEYFKGRISIEQFHFIEEYANIYEVELPKYENKIGEVTITIKYILNQKMSSDSFVEKDDRFSFFGKYFWYPRNVYQEPNKFSIIANTTSSYNLHCGLKSIETKVEDDVKESSCDFTKFSKPIDFVIEKR
ncbi:MAG: hypothetical protein U9N34_06650 [Candidatus Cloacimonadota bacterium]|nr:hypothetical protein [Candidatus Cloacimonadota bacterium]